MISNWVSPFQRFVALWLVALFLVVSPRAGQTEEEYSFDLEEFENKTFDWGGYAEVKWEHLDFNQDGSLYHLNFYREPRSNLDRLSSILQFEGNFNKDKVAFNWRFQATARQDEIDWDDNFEVFEAFASLKPTPLATIDLGKKVFKWGKGYAWNPVGFIDRPKDPNNPEEALEGLVGAGVDLIKSFPGSLQTAALTAVVLPVWQGVNEDFGETDNVNLAAKLYLLYRDADIDLVWFTGNSRSTRYGVDFSKNIASNFEIHGELAHVPTQKSKVLDASGVLSVREEADTSYLLGIRYLTENDITTIIEFYHNDDGYTEAEMEEFFQLVADADSQYQASGDETLFQQAQQVSQSGYGKPQPGRNYLYMKITQKEPFDILYLTPGVTTIVNLDDDSYTVSPEVVYSGFENWELRLRGSVINGDYFTENGEKQNSSKLEFRVRYFF
ncbi:MAG: hypothetical protein KAS94_01220 [Desulfobulbaceae bacterium]|nr:hypothetical protein [Desulfobulbaceae bacterium]